MTKTVAVACAAAVVFFALGFMLPQRLNATPQPVEADSYVASMETVTAVPGMADQFDAQKANAVQSELPAQF